MRYKLMIPGGRERIASTSGHITILTDEFKEVPSVLEPEARRAGAVSEENFNAILKGQQASGTEPAKVDRKERDELIELAINELIDDANPANMTGSGRPKVAAIEQKTGLSDVKAKEIDDVWAKVTGDSF